MAGLLKYWQLNHSIPKEEIDDLFNEDTFVEEDGEKCPKCGKHRTEKRILFNSYYLHCFNCDK